MTLSRTQIKILYGIQGKLRRGDITAIAKKVGVSKEYVGMVLNPDLDYFREDIVDEAIKIVANREQVTKKLLKSIMSAA